MDQVQPLIKLVSNSGTNVDETCVLYMDSQELAKQVKKIFICVYVCGYFYTAVDSLCVLSIV